MAKIHLSLPQSHWVQEGYTWCLHFAPSAKPRHQVQVTDKISSVTCLRCLSLREAAQADPKHPLRDYVLLEHRQRVGPLATAQAVAHYCRDLVHEPQTVVWILMLTVNFHLVYARLLFRGLLSGNQYHPREVLQPVLQHNAHGFLLVQNHPCGELVPTDEETERTQHLQQCCALLQIPFIDHVIVSRQGFYSLREQTTLWD